MSFHSFFMLFFANNQLLVPHNILFIFLSLACLNLTVYSFSKQANV